MASIYPFILNKELYEMISNPKNKHDPEFLKDLADKINQGVNINFQYKNCGNNTLLHIATENGDEISAKFFIKHKANLSIENNAGETPECVAIRLNNTTIQKYIIDEPVAINEKIIHTIDLSNIENENLRFDSSCRILKISKCFSLIEFNKNLEKIGSKLHSASYLFFVAIEISDKMKENFQSIFTTLCNILGNKRPIIIEIMVGNEATIYYREASSLCFNQLKSVQSADRHKFEILYSNIIGNISKSVLSVALKRSDISTLANIIGVFDSILCLRFLILFGQRLEVSSLVKSISEQQIDNGAQCLIAVLDYFDAGNNTFFQLSENQQEKIRNSRDGRNYNLVMIAVEENNVEALKFFLKLSFDLDYVSIDQSGQSTTAIDVAWNKEHLVCLFELLTSDSCYPKDFSKSVLFSKSNTGSQGIIDSIFLFISDQEMLIDAITCENQGIIDIFIKKYPKIKKAYNISNKSALTFAIEEKKPKIVEYLQNKQFSIGHNKIHPGFMIRKKHTSGSYTSGFKPIAKSHFYHLIKRMKCIPHPLYDESHYWPSVSEILNNLEIIEKDCCIMKALKRTKNIIIIFDFTRMDVSGIRRGAPLNADGLFDPDWRVVSVAAADYNINIDRISGVLAHELTHYVMQLIFRNNCKPYYSSEDDISKSDFETVFNELQVFLSNKQNPGDSVNFVMWIVFNESGIDSKGYNIAQKHAELIVRVPHLLALCKNPPQLNDLNLIRNNYGKNLFEYFKTHTLPQIEGYSKGVQSRYDSNTTFDTDVIMESL